MKKILTGILFVFLLSGSSLLAQSEDKEKRDPYQSGEYEKRVYMRKMHDGGRGFSQRMRGERGHMGRSQKKMGHMQMLLNRAEELELTEDQIEKMKEMKFDFEMEKIDHQARLKKAELILRKMRRDDDASQQQVFDAIDEVFRLKADGQKSKYAMKQEMKSVLTKKQLEKLQKRQEGMKKRKGKKGKESGTYYRQKQKGKR